MFTRTLLWFMPMRSPTLMMQNLPHQFQECSDRGTVSAQSQLQESKVQESARPKERKEQQQPGCMTIKWPMMNIDLWSFFRIGWLYILYHIISYYTSQPLKYHCMVKCSQISNSESVGIQSLGLGTKMHPENPEQSWNLAGTFRFFFGFGTCSTSPNFILPRCRKGGTGGNSGEWSRAELSIFFFMPWTRLEQTGRCGSTGAGPPPKDQHVLEMSVPGVVQLIGWLCC